MNKVILMGRLTRDPEIRYTQGDTPITVAKYTLAVARKFKRENDPDADFFNCVVFGKSGEFAEKYFKKGQMICVCGRIQIKTYNDESGQKRWLTEIIVEDQDFAESKTSFEARQKSGSNIDLSDVLDETDLPF